MRPSTFRIRGRIQVGIFVSVQTIVCFGILPAVKCQARFEIKIADAVARQDKKLIFPE
jgi:hypothetical protein